MAQVILLERVDSLGEMGDVVTVKPGYARNFLLPQKKALRASKDNIAYFEAQKKNIKAESDKKKKDAEKMAKKVDGIIVALIRQASEAGHLFGSVNARDIAEAAANKSGESITKQMVELNQNYKTVGLFPVEVVLHPEVKTEITVNIARTEEEAEIQEKTGKALIADNAQDEPKKAKSNVDDQNEPEKNLEGVLEDDALQAKKDKEAAKKEAESSSEDTEDTAT